MRIADADETNDEGAGERCGGGEEGRMAERQVERTVATHEEAHEGAGVPGGDGPEGGVGEGDEVAGDHGLAKGRAVDRVDVAALRGIGGDDDEIAAGGVVDESTAVEPFVLVAANAVEDVEDGIAGVPCSWSVVGFGEDDGVAGLA